MRSVAIECGLCRSGRAARTEVLCRSGCDESKMAGAGRGGKTVPLGYEEPISCDTERCVVVESAPVATFKVPQPQFLLQFLIVPFDDPAVFGHFDQIFKLGVQRQRRYPVLSDDFGKYASRELISDPFLAAFPFEHQVAMIHAEKM